MSDIDALLQAQSSGSQVGDVGSMLSAQAKSAPVKAAAPAVSALSTGTRVAQGLGDTEFGLGQLAEHIPVLSTITKGWRELIQQGLQTAGFNNAAEIFGGTPTSGDLTDQKAAANFDGIVQQREQEYQQARQAAGQTGIDWWRLGGQAINPINYMAPEGAGASMGARVGQGAVQGAVLGAEQPSQTPGSFWLDKMKSMGFGALGGAGASAAVEGMSGILKAGVGLAKKYLGTAAPDTAAAESIVNDALRAKGVDPSTVDLNLLSGMKQDVKDALAGGADISPESIVNRAKAESLPVPVRLMKGQATGDPMLYSKEQNLRGVTGVGEPITQRLQEQNQAFIDNLDALGAKNAPDVVSTGHKINQSVSSFWDDIQQKKEQLYDAVKNSEGQTASMDNVSAGREIRETLGSPQAFHAWTLLPDNMKKTIADLEEDNLPLTVSNFQALDKQWGMAARGAEPSTAHAINQAREILGNAPIQDAEGEQSMQAYQLAKQAHAQQMSLVNPKLLNGKPNPNYQPLVKAVVMDGEAPENLFTSHFLKEAPSVAGKNQDFLSKLDPTFKPTLSNTLMGSIKDQALSFASDERGTVSQKVLTDWARKPVKSGLLDTLLAPEQAQTFRNLADTAEVAKRFPVASTVNTSNTSPALVNAVGSALKTNAVAQIAKRLPLVKQIAEPFAEGAKQAETQSAVESALKPGVTLKNLLKGTPAQANNRRALSRLIIPGAIAAEQADSTPPQ